MVRQQIVDAQMSHLLKYTKIYDELYPTATKVMIRCESSMFWHSEEKNVCRHFLELSA